MRKKLRFKGNIAAVLDEIVNTGVGTPPAGSGNRGTAVQNELDGGKDRDTLVLASNVDTVRKGGEGTLKQRTVSKRRTKKHGTHVSPARATVLIINKKVICEEKEKIRPEGCAGCC